MNKNGGGRRAAGAALALAGLATALAHAQQTPLRVGTDLITVDVSVLDGERRPVRGLTADDFTVFEDGKPRPVVAFSVVDVPTTDAGREGGSHASSLRDAPSDVVANDLPAEGRLVVIMFDRSIPAGGPVATARRIAAAAVDQLGPGDVAAVVRSGGFADNGRVQGFTADRRLLMAAIDSTFTGTTPAELNPSPIPGDPGSMAGCHCGLCMFDTLGNVVDAMSEAPRRRKVLLFIGSAVTMPTAVAGDQCYSVTRGPRERLDRQLEMSNVTVHAIDPSGVLTTAPRAAFVVPQGVPSARAPEPPGTYSQADARRLDNLRVLPEQTGGRLVANTNDPGDSLPAIFDESRSYYLLGFEPAAVPDGQFHRIEVRVSQRGTNVRARNGYVFDRTTPAAVAADDDPTGAMSDLVGALRAQQPRQGLALAMNIAPLSAPQASTPVAVLVGAPRGKQEGPRRYTMAAGAFDLRGRPVVVQMQTVAVVGAGSMDMLDGLTARLNLAPGRYEIRAAVRDERTRAVGSVFSFLDVPEPTADAIALSGLVFHREPSPAPSAGSALDGLVPFVPTVARHFAPADRVSVFARVQQSGRDGPAIMRAVVIDRSGATRFEQSATIDASRFSNGSAPYSLALPLAGLPPGDYLLRIEATAGQERTQRDVRFAVRP